MKKFVSFILILIMASVIHVPINAKAAVISQASASLYIGDSLKLSVLDTGSYVLWKSSDKSVATVSKTGKVTGKSEGEATITATIGAGSTGEKLKCIVTVNSRIGIADTAIVMSNDEYQEIPITLANPKENEKLFYSEDVTYASTSLEWAGKNVLRIIPEKNGYSRVFLYSSESNYSKDVDPNNIKILNVFVVKNVDWINADYLEDYLDTVDSININDLYGVMDDNVDFDENGEERIKEEYTLIYNGKSIGYKRVNYTVYFNADDLREAGIL